jgi:hypothetical protein
LFAYPVDDVSDNKFSNGGTVSHSKRVDEARSDWSVG